MSKAQRGTATTGIEGRPTSADPEEIDLQIANNDSVSEPPKQNGAEEEYDDESGEYDDEEEDEDDDDDQF